MLGWFRPTLWSALLIESVEAQPTAFHSRMVGVIIQSPGAVPVGFFGFLGILGPVSFRFSFFLGFFCRLSSVRSLRCSRANE